MQHIPLYRILNKRRILATSSVAWDGCQKPETKGTGPLAYQAFLADSQ